MIGEIAYREASIDDLEKVLLVERSAQGAPHWSEAVWRKSFEVGARKRVVLVAEVDGSVCGFVALSSLATVAEVENIAVSEALRRRGVGQGLLTAGLEWARRTQAEAVELEVRASNQAALALYQALGFQEQGRRVAYYGDPVEDAVLMSIGL